MNKRARNIIILLVILLTCTASFFVFNKKPEKVMQSDKGPGTEAQQGNEENRYLILGDNAILDSYTIYDNMQTSSVPSFSDYQFVSAEFDSDGEDYVKLFAFQKLKQYYYYTSNLETSSYITKYAFATERELDMDYYELNELYFYASVGAKEYLSDADSEDALTFLDYINDFSVNAAINYDPIESDLEKYGLLEPQRIVTLEFFNKRESELEDPAILSFYVQISIGFPVIGKDEYYVMLSSNSNEFDSNAVYTLSANYAEYFLDMCPDNLNGINSGRTLANDAIPVLNPETIVSVRIYEFEFNGRWVYDEEHSSMNYYNNGNNDSYIGFYGKSYADISQDIYGGSVYDYKKDILISYDSTGVLTISSPTLTAPFDNPAYSVKIMSSVAKQLFEFLSNPDELRYTETVYENVPKDNTCYDILEKYGLFYPLRLYTFTYRQTKTQTNQWSLRIGTDGNEYYVYSSNSDNIYKMPDSLVDYLMALDEDVLSGEKVYE